ncbi:YiiD C-terminal domain-containing protein [Thalassotalea euphylliae]|uniref:bifunctional GNAT family N-acetyltransferase/hotdog fold thioesterase n=1 Tax=Thalassotalea euphylliae TaxID=1655234 RepID=UPI0036253BB4
MFFVKTPESKEEFRQYYHFRWQTLRAPWRQPEGSEQDELEAQATHRMIVDDSGRLVAVGRLHKVNQFQAQIRYMAVDETIRGQGLGRLMIDALELQAAKEGVTEIMLNAREVAVNFYRALGYDTVEKTHVLYGEIQHYSMRKNISSNPQHQQALSDALTDTWHNTIPLSKAMNMRVSHYDDEQMITTTDVAFNKNLHNTMFAGSIYTQATLTGWGWVYFQLAKAQLAGDIVLADAQIKYFSPIAGPASGEVMRDHVEGDLSRLSKGKAARMNINVNMRCGDKVAATFSGKYAIKPGHK